MQWNVTAFERLGCNSHPSANTSACREGNFGRKQPQCTEYLRPSDALTWNVYNYQMKRQSSTSAYDVTFRAGVSTNPGRLPA